MALEIVSVRAQSDFAVDSCTFAHRRSPWCRPPHSVNSLRLGVPIGLASNDNNNVDITRIFADVLHSSQCQNNAADVSQWWWWRHFYCLVRQWAPLLVRGHTQAGHADNRCSFHSREEWRGGLSPNCGECEQVSASQVPSGVYVRQRQWGTIGSVVPTR